MIIRPIFFYSVLLSTNVLQNNLIRLLWIYVFPGYQKTYITHQGVLCPISNTLVTLVFLHTPLLVLVLNIYM